MHNRDKKIKALIIAACVFSLVLGVISLIILVLADMNSVFRIIIPALLIGAIVLIVQYLRQ